jgi:hypothetical protein
MEKSTRIQKKFFSDSELTSFPQGYQQQYFDKSAKKPLKMGFL